MIYSIFLKRVILFAYFSSFHLLESLSRRCVTIRTIVLCGSDNLAGLLTRPCYFVLHSLV
ncbi:hypothetical protein SLEP1_g4026 [Rubroshorea leprosula]|uniref:Uncharacterized protein n=1 Tax=Rubroshorea leprosula TaxID=152421 RepID=A0AAV5HMV3_9ROSI|nr:hypothetical protein SLEP1_g4026 [Rubroshorea leprosula]